MRYAAIKLALEALDSHYDITLNTDNGYQSVRSKEAIMKRTKELWTKRYPMWSEIVDLYLELRAALDEIENSKTDNVALHIFKHPDDQFLLKEILQ